MKNIPIRQLSAQHARQSNNGGFSIRNLIHITKGEKLLHKLHKHNFYLILAIEKGTGIHEIDFTPYKIHNNALFILRPGQVHQLQLSKNSTGFIVEFDPAFYQPDNSIVSARFKKAVVKNYCKVAAGQYMQLHSLLAAIHTEFSNAQASYVDAIKAYLNLFFIEYMRQSSTKDNKVVESNYHQQQFDELMLLLEKNCATVKTVTGYAQLLNLSPYQLNAITTQAVGKTVSQLINEQLILESKRYLLATPLQVKDIAAAIGFNDVSYFVRFFKKHTSHTPEAFRKNFR